METSSYSVSKCKLFLVAEQDHTSLVIGQKQYFGLESAARKCSRNAPCCQWIIILVYFEYTFPNQVFMMSPCDASMFPPNDICQQTTSSYKTTYCVAKPANVHQQTSTGQHPGSCHACICPLTNVYHSCVCLSTNEYQTTSRSHKTQWSFGMSAYTHQTMSTRQSLPSDARTCWKIYFQMQI